MPINSGLGATPGPDGAFERFLTAAIATIITLMFSWRLLLEVNEEENVSELNNRMETRDIFTHKSSDEKLSEREFDSSSDESENGDAQSIERGVYDPIGVPVSDRQIMDLELDSIRIETDDGDDEVYERSSDTDDTGSAKSVCSQESLHNNWKEYSWEEDLYDSCIHTRRTFKDFVSKDDSDIPSQTHSFLTQMDFMATPNFLETRNPPNSPDVVLQVYKGEASAQLKDMYTQSTSFSSVKTDTTDDYEVEIIDSDDELYYTSVLEPIMEEDSDDIHSSESDSDDKQTDHKAVVASENLLVESKVRHVQLSVENTFTPDRTQVSKIEQCFVSGRSDRCIEPPPPFRDGIRIEKEITVNISALSPRQENEGINLTLSDTNNNVRPVMSVSVKDRHCPGNLKIDPLSPPESVISSPGSSLPSSPVRTYAISDGPDDSFSDDSSSSASVITVVSVRTSSDDGDIKYQRNANVEKNRKVFQPGMSHTYEDIYHLNPAQANDTPLIHPSKTENAVTRTGISAVSHSENTGISENDSTSDGKFIFKFGSKSTIDFSDCPDQPREITSSDEDDLYFLDQESDDDSFYLLIGGEGNLRNFDTFTNLNACGLSPAEFSDADSSSAFDDTGQRFVFSRVEDVDTDVQKIQYITDRVPPNKSLDPVVISDDAKSWVSEERVKLEIVESSNDIWGSTTPSDHGVADDNHEQMEITNNISIRTEILADMEVITQHAPLDQNEHTFKCDTTDPDRKEIHLRPDPREVKDIDNISNENYQSMQINYETNVNNKSQVLSNISGSLQPCVVSEPEPGQTRLNADASYNNTFNCSNIDCSTTTTTTLKCSFSNKSNINQITPNSYIIDTHKPLNLTTEQFDNTSDLQSSTEEVDSGVLVDKHSDEKQQHCLEEIEFIQMTGKKNVHFATDPALIVYDENEQIDKIFNADIEARVIGLDYIDQPRDKLLRTRSEATYKTRPLSADCSQERIPIDFSRYRIDRQPDNNEDKLCGYANIDTTEILRPAVDYLTSSLGYGKQYSPGGSTTKSVYLNETGVNTISVGKVIRAPAHLPSDLRENCHASSRSPKSKLPYRSILQQHVSPASINHVLYKMPDKIIPVSRQRINATRKRFLSQENLAADNDRFYEKFQEHKHSLTHISPVHYSTGHLDKDTKLCLSIEKPYIVRHISDLYSLRHNEIDSQEPPDITHLHKDCMFSPEKQEEILNTTISIENLRAHLSNECSMSSLLKTDIDSGSSSMNTALLSETELDHPLLLQFPLERAYSMNDLGTARRPKKTGKSRFADRRRHPKYQSLQTLETDLDEVFAKEEGNLSRVPSVHELRVTRSLQKLNVPDWYKRSSVSRSGSTQSLFTRRESTSTISSFGFIPSVTSSPCPSVSPGSTTVVIKTRVTPSNSRLLRVSKLPTTPETSSIKPKTPSIQLPSDKYRKSQKKTELMPIPIVSFSKLREMFETKCKRRELPKSPPSPKLKDKIEASKNSPPQARAIEKNDSLKKLQSEVKPILRTETQSDDSQLDTESHLIENRNDDPVNKPEMPKKPKVNKKRRYSNREIGGEIASRPVETGVGDERGSYSYPILSVRQHSSLSDDLRLCKQRRSNIEVVYANTCLSDIQCNVEPDDVSIDEVFGDLLAMSDRHKADNVLPAQTTYYLNGSDSSVAIPNNSDTMTRNFMTLTEEFCYNDQLCAHQGKCKDVIVSCENPDCGRRVKLKEAKDYYKTCHGCYTYYCCRACRLADWNSHKNICILSRYNSACKHIIKFVNYDTGVQYQFSRIARRGYLTEGRGCLTLYFSDINSASDFFFNGHDFSKLKDYLPVFLSIPEIGRASTMGACSQTLIDMCKEYNPEIKYVISVAISLPTLLPIKPILRKTDPVIQSHARLRLSLAHVHSEVNNNSFATLILTATSGRRGVRDFNQRKSREICFINIQKKLRQHGVQLRHEYPDIYSTLIDYVVGAKPFSPLTIYPVDSQTGSRFMCVIIPDMEPQVEWTSDPNLPTQLDIAEEDDYRQDRCCLMSFAEDTLV